MLVLGNHTFRNGQFWSWCKNLYCSFFLVEIFSSGVCLQLTQIPTGLLTSLHSIKSQKRVLWLTFSCISLIFLHFESPTFYYVQLKAALPLLMSQSSNLNCSIHVAVYLLSHLFVAADFCIHAALSRLLYGTCEPATRNTWKTIGDTMSFPFSCVWRWGI